MKVGIYSVALLVSNWDVSKHGSGTFIAFESREMKYWHGNTGVSS
jgi:hypothetical protein